VVEQLIFFKQNHYKISCGITHLPYVKQCSITFDDNAARLYDPGCDASGLLGFLWKTFQSKYRK
jgi:hypothetical protein